jgi:hypothetical protein
MTKDPLTLMTAAYEKYNPGYFRIATLQGEYILVTDNDKVAEYLRAPDDVLSMQDAANDQQQIPYTMGWGIGYRTYHTPIVRTKLTSSIKSHVGLMTTEIRAALDDLIGASEDYTPCSIYDTIAMVVARVSNRIMVSDDDLYQNKDFLRTAIDYAEAVVLSAELLKPFPNWMKHILVRVTPVWACRRKAKFHLEPLLRKRLAGNFDDAKRPDDLLQWLADAAPPVDRNIDQMVERLMAMKVGSIHTTTMVGTHHVFDDRDESLTHSKTFTAALYKLAASPEDYMTELREELENVLQEGPLTKESLNKLHKMNSFLRESARVNNCGFRESHPADVLLSPRQEASSADTRHHSSSTTQCVESFYFQQRHGNPSGR